MAKHMIYGWKDEQVAKQSDEWLKTEQEAKRKNEFWTVRLAGLAACSVIGAWGMDDLLGTVGR